MYSMSSPSFKVDKRIVATKMTNWILQIILSSRNPIDKIVKAYSESDDKDTFMLALTTAFVQYYTRTMSERNQKCPITKAPTPTPQVSTI